MKGEAMMKKRHLEILGYQVLQVSRKILYFTPILFAWQKCVFADNMHFYRFPTLNGTQWSFPQKMLGKNISGRKYLQSCPETLSKLDIKIFSAISSRETLWKDWTSGYPSFELQDNTVHFILTYVFLSCTTFTTEPKMHINQVIFMLKVNMKYRLLAFYLCYEVMDDF